MKLSLYSYLENDNLVRIKESTDVRLARFLDRVHQGVTGIVENDVELAEMRCACAIA